MKTYYLVTLNWYHGRNYIWYYGCDEVKAIHLATGLAKNFQRVRLWTHV